MNYSSLERLKKAGFFNQPEDIDLSLSDEELGKLMKFETIYVEQNDKRYSLFIRIFSNMDNLKQSDLVIRELK